MDFCTVCNKRQRPLTIATNCCWNNAWSAADTVSVGVPPSVEPSFKRVAMAGEGTDALLLLLLLLVVGAEGGVEETREEDDGSGEVGTI